MLDTTIPHFEPEIKDCTRRKPHTGPCNGWFTSACVLAIKPFPTPDHKVYVVTITEDGDLLYLKTGEHDIFVELGEVVTKRASHVLPTRFWKRQAFRFLRLVFGNKSRVATWTRGWRTTWFVDPSPVGAPAIDKTFKNRQDAVDFEVEYLNDWFLRRIRRPRPNRKERGSI